MDNIGFIGLGNMGLGMANNILKKNDELNVFTRTRSKLDKLIGGNVIEHDSIKSIASKCNILLTCLPNIDASIEVFLGEGGVEPEPFGIPINLIHFSSMLLLQLLALTLIFRRNLLRQKNWNKFLKFKALCFKKKFGLN